MLGKCWGSLAQTLPLSQPLSTSAFQTIGGKCCIFLSFLFFCNYSAKNSCTRLLISCTLRRISCTLRRISCTLTLLSCIWNRVSCIFQTSEAISAWLVLFLRIICKNKYINDTTFKNIYYLCNVILRKRWQHWGERLSFDPPVNLENSTYMGEKSESCFSCGCIYTAIPRYGVSSHIYLQVWAVSFLHIRVFQNLQAKKCK